MLSYPWASCASFQGWNTLEYYLLFMQIFFSMPFPPFSESFSALPCYFWESVTKTSHSTHNTAHGILVPQINSEINDVLHFDLLYTEQRTIPVAITFSGTWCQVSQLTNPSCMPFIQHSYSLNPQGFAHLCKTQWDSSCFSYSLSVSWVTAVSFAWKCFVPSKQPADWVLSPPCVFQRLQTSSYGA